MRSSPPYFVLFLITIAPICQGQNWTNAPLPSANTYRPSGLGVFSDRLILASSRSVSYTADGQEWHEAQLNADSLTVSNFFGRPINLFVTPDTAFIQGGQIIFSSKDGVTWDQVPEPPQQYNPNNLVFATDGTGGVVADHGSVSGSNSNHGAIYFSKDLQTWNTVSSLPFPDWVESIYLWELHYGNGYYAIRCWISGTDPSTSQSRFEYVVIYSKDGGESWAIASIPGSPTINDINYGNGWFFVRAGTDEHYRARTPESFESFTVAPSTYASGMNAALSGAGQFFTHESSADPNNTVVASLDGANWQAIGDLPTEGSVTFSGAAYFLDKYYLLGTHNGLSLTTFLATLEQDLGPSIKRHIKGSTVFVEGRDFRLSVLPNNEESVSLQWYRDGQAIIGATQTELVIRQAVVSQAGKYYCQISKPSGAILSDLVDVQLVSKENAARLANLAVNTTSGAGDDVLNVGFVLKGSTPHPLTIRGIGPTLQNFNITGFLTDPELSVYQGGTVVSSNDDWSGDVGVSLGAFALPAGSKDAATTSTLQPTPHSVIVGGKNNETGVVLAELYDGDTSNTSTRMINVAARASVTASQPLIVGFVITGNSPLQVVVRGIGPTLGNFGVSGALPNPKITLYRGNTVIETNDDWQQDDGRILGAFPLDSGTQDAILSATLQPGLYTAHVTASEGSAEEGVVLVEVYEAF